MKCTNTLGEYEVMVALPIPRHMKKINGGFYTEKTHIYVDPCLLEELQFLWSRNSHTFSSCCGHGQINGSILVLEEDTSLMIDLGYVENLEFRAKQPSHTCRECFSHSAHTENERKLEWIT